MAKKPTKLPPTPEAKANALSVVRSHESPLNVAALVKRLAPPHQIPAKDLEMVLEEFVAAGALLRLPGKTAKAKPQYWDRDPASLRRAALQEAIAKALHDSEIPLAADDLVKVVPGKPKAAELTLLLEGLVGSGTLFSIPKTGAKGRPRYWSRPAGAYGRQALRKLLATKGPQEEKKVQSALKEFTGEQIRRIVDEAVAARELFRHPIAGKVKKELLGTRPASPEPYLVDVAAQLARIVQQLLAADVSRDELRRYLLQVLETAGISFSSSNSAASGATQATRSEQPSSGVDLIALIRRLDPGADRGALVGARDLRRIAQLEKDKFDQAVLQLAREGRLSLHYHDYPASLTPTERDELVTDGNGTYYIGVALRQNSI